MNDARTVRRFAFPLALAAACLAGCATRRERPAAAALGSPDGLPLSAGFVYSERVHAVAGRFSLAEAYWNHLFPEAASAFAEARRFDSYDAALHAGVDALVIARADVHGAPDGFKCTLLVVVRDRGETFLTDIAFHEKPGSADTAETTFAAMGRQLREHLAGSTALARLAAGPRR